MPRDKLTLSWSAGLIVTAACAGTTLSPAGALGVPNLTTFSHQGAVETLHISRASSTRDQLHSLEEPLQVHSAEAPRSVGEREARQVHASDAPRTEGSGHQQSMDTHEGGQRSTTELRSSRAAEDAQACERAVFFDTGSTRLDRGSRRRLDRVAECLRHHRVPQATVIGRTDARGSARYNTQLGLERARAVAAYLQTRGIAEEQLRVRSQGELAAVDSEVLWPVDRAVGVRVDTR